MTNIKHIIIIEDFLSAYFVSSFIFGTILINIPIINLLLFPYCILPNVLISLVGAMFYSIFTSYMLTHENIKDYDDRTIDCDNIKNYDSSVVNLVVTYKHMEIHKGSLYKFNRTRYETVPDHYGHLYNILCLRNIQYSFMQLISQVINSCIFHVTTYGLRIYEFIDKKKKQ